MATSAKTMMMLLHIQIGGEGSRTPVLEAVYTSFYMLSR